MSFFFFFSFFCRYIRCLGCFWTSILFDLGPVAYLVSGVCRSLVAAGRALGRFSLGTGMDSRFNMNQKHLLIFVRDDT
ncbi:hypothetical protein B0T17DRAFT_519546 [Bombardia bombarda]|uniref:Uncharacterized protein n=1 Tax=Bombardia bombarda TaxID=252184 RepID=A0AA39XM86_9PEZI|nr:hypothetical protein B0T17DRAFT_519546 [Bombardia bombarda]